MHSGYCQKLNEAKGKAGFFNTYFLIEKNESFVNKLVKQMISTKIKKIMCYITQQLKK